MSNFFKWYEVTSKLGHHCGFKSTEVRKGDKVFVGPTEPPLIVNDPHTAATQIAFTMRLADAPLSEVQFVTLCAYLKARAEE